MLSQAVFDSARAPCQLHATQGCGGGAPQGSA